MVSTTKSVAARERARAGAAAFREREQKLEDLAVGYFSAADQVEKIFEVRDREITAATSKAEKAAAASLDEADKSIREMLALGVSASEVRDRLGCTQADIRRATSEPTAAGATAHEFGQ